MFFLNKFFNFKGQVRELAVLEDRVVSLNLLIYDLLKKSDGFRFERNLDFSSVCVDFSKVKYEVLKFKDLLSLSLDVYSNDQFKRSVGICSCLKFSDIDFLSDDFSKSFNFGKDYEVFKRRECLSIEDMISLSSSFVYKNSFDEGSKDLFFPPKEFFKYVDENFYYSDLIVDNYLLFLNDIVNKE